MRESVYQNRLMDRIKELLPGCVIQPNDPQKTQGIPDLLILFGKKWAMLEVKASADSPTRPNQPYWVEHFNGMSFASFIYPENEEAVLDALQKALGTRRKARVPQS